MRILFDQGVPGPLRQSLSGHEIDTAYENGWATLENGQLLDAVEESGYEVFITTDKNLRYQQNLAHRTISIIVLPTPSWPRLRQLTAEVLEAVNRTGPGSYHEVPLA